MARKKTETPEIAETLTEVEAPKEEAKVEAKATKESTIPAVVDETLKRYPNYEKLYVTKEGFAFVEGTSIAIRKDAVLYTNKYYKP